MADHYRALTGFSYPAPESLALVEAAGGLRNLTDEQRASVVMREVAPLDYCDDMPPEALVYYQAQGLVDIVSD